MAQRNIRSQLHRAICSEAAAMAKVLFRLREYDDAFRHLFGSVIRAHAEEAYPLLKKIPTESRPDIHIAGHAAVWRAAEE
jgi:hypothetical protein